MIYARGHEVIANFSSLLFFSPVLMGRTVLFPYIVFMSVSVKISQSLLVIWPLFFRRLRKIGKGDY